VIWRGQDKGRGPKWLKPLSAHRFLRDSQKMVGDSESARLPIAPKKKPGTQFILHDLVVYMSGFEV